jgi:hypothetical protein
MREFDSKTVRSRLSTYRVPVIALAVVLIGGAGFAATGGVQAAKAILVKIKLQGADGTVFEGSLQPDESGLAEVHVEGDDGQTTKLLMQVQSGGLINVPPQGEGEPHQIMVQVETDADSLDPEKLKLLVGDNNADIVTMQHVSVRSDGEESHWSVEPPEGNIQLQVEVTGGEGEAVATAMAAGPRIVDTIAEPVDSFEWQGADGFTRTISIVASSSDDKLGGYEIYSTLTDGRYAEIGRIILTDPAAATPMDLVVDDDGAANLILTRPDGGEIKVPVRPVLTAEELEAKTPRGIMLRKTDHQPARE